MQNIVNEVFNFFYNLYSSISNWASVKGFSNEFNTFINKTALDGDLIRIGATWKETCMLVIPSVIVIILIMLVFKTIARLFTGRVKR